MFDNGLPHDPLSASQFAIQCLSKFTVSQIANRSTGEYFPNISGDFLSVDSCDMPARISFNSSGIDQSIPLVSGMTVEGNFSGITVWHDNYTGFTASQPQIVFALGRGNKLNVNNMGGRTLLHLPFELGTFSAAGIVVSFPVPYGYKKLTISGLVLVTAAAAPARVVATFGPRSAAGTTVLPASFTRGTINYNTPSSLSKFAVADVVAGVGLNIWNFVIPETEVTLPTLAESIRVTMSYAAAVTSSDNIFFEATAS